MPRCQRSITDGCISDGTFAHLWVYHGIAKGFLEFVSQSLRFTASVLSVVHESSEVMNDSQRNNLNREESHRSLLE